MRPDEDVSSRKNLLGDAARNAQRGGQPAGEVPAAAQIRFSAPLDKRGIVRMAGAGFVEQFLLIARARVEVFNDGAERAATGFALH